MAQQLPIQQQQGYNLPPLQNPQVINVSPQQPVIGTGGVQKSGIDWGGALQGLGNYLTAASQGINPNANTMGAGLAGIR